MRSEVAGTSAIILAGGFGGRFYPFTKSVPKELLPVGGIPAIHWSIRECLAAGIERVIVVTRPDSDLTKEHFLASPGLSCYLQHIGLWRDTKSVYQDLLEYTTFVREDECPYGTLAPTLQAASKLGDSSQVLVCFPDEVLFSANQPGATVRALLGSVDTQYSCIFSVLPPDSVSLSQFGAILGSATSQQGLLAVDDVQQKPHTIAQGTAYPLISRLLLNAEILPRLRRAFASGETDLTSAVAKSADPGSLFAHVTTERWGTVGDPTSYLELLNSVASTLPNTGLVEFYSEVIQPRVDARGASRPQHPPSYRNVHAPQPPGSTASPHFGQAGSATTPIALSQGIPSGSRM